MKLKEFLRFSRPVLENDNNGSDALIFQFLDIDFINNKIKVFGVTDNGVSVSCLIEGFFPYFYIAYPNGRDWSAIQKLRESGMIKDVSRCHMSQVYGYHRDDSSETFLKITTFTPYFIHSIISQLSNDCKIFESDIDYIVRYMTDAQIDGGCCWLEIPAQCWRPIGRASTEDRCQLNVSVMDWKNVISHKPEGKWGRLAPLRILSFDIECSGRVAVFPQPELDPIIQIGNHVIEHNASHPFVSVIFTLGSCSSIDGATVLSFDSETAMLSAWAKFLTDIMDPDIITGYNINDFDLPYLIRRAEILQLSEFSYLGRDLSKKTVVKDFTISGRHTKRVNMEGRCLFDLLPIIRKEYKLRAYSLNAVSFHFLGEMKEDLHYSKISSLQSGDKETRKRIAIYCLKDSLLPLKLIDKLMLIVNYVEMARITGIPLSYVVNRGQQMKVFSQILRKTKERNLVIPKRDQFGEKTFEYEGATVIEPLKGYYNCQIVTLDFASLYPSIMISYNMCYSTLLLTPSEFPELKEGKDYILSPTKNCFVKEHIRKGFLPEILRDLLDSRKKAKDEMKKASGKWEQQCYNARQMALKITCNSVYGFTGTQKGGLMPCLEVSQSVTAIGRRMITETKENIERLFEGTRVIYGDTDSVMLKTTRETTDSVGVDESQKGQLIEAFHFGRRIAQYLTDNFFHQPIKLEFEKIYFPYLLVNKKRYAGLCYMTPNDPPAIDCKGIETIRRDNCPLVAYVIERCLEKILIDRNPDAAVTFAKGIISDLFLDKIDISQLVISKELQKDEYKVKQAHSELVKRLEARSKLMAVNVPKVGDRVPYVILRGDKGSKIYERSEDPIFAMDNKLGMDFDYYLENQLKNPLIRLFEPILGHKAEAIIMRGNHLLKRKADNPSSCLLSVLKFAVSCIACHLPLTRSDSQRIQLCGKCNKLKVQLGEEAREKLRHISEQFEQIKQCCVACQNGLLSYDEILCSNSDCPTFYRRRRVELELRDQQVITNKLDF